MQKVIISPEDYQFIVTFIETMTERFGVPAKVLAAINRAEISEVEVKKEPDKK